MTNDGITCPKKLKERIAALESSRREQIRKNHEEEYRAGLDDDGSEPYQFDLEAIKLRDKIMKRKQQLKQAIISVGPTDTRPISPKIRQNEVIDYLRKNKNKVPGKPQELETSALMKYVDHGERMNSGTPGIKRLNRKQFAKQLEFKIQELKIAKEHKHSIQFRVARLAEYKPGELKETGKFWKYWLLNAKQTNGNGWGVSNQTIRQNIARFIGRPFVITDKSWIDDTEYSTYEHPYLPTNHLPTIFNHQAKFRVGDIVDVFEDKNGDYFATIKPLEKFANRSPPPFCSPAVFQLDPREPENNISKWEALHLAGLDRDPAYGPAVAMLKGTCIGTSHECSIQFKGARSRLAFMKGFKETSGPGHGQYIAPDGKIYEPEDRNIFTHVDSVREFGKPAGLEFIYDKDPGGFTPVEDEDIHNFLRKTKTIRLTHVKGRNGNSAHVQIADRMTPAQIKTIKDLSHSADISYTIGEELLDDITQGEGVNNLLRHHSQIFGAKLNPGAFTPISDPLPDWSSTIMDEAGDMYRSKFPGDTHYDMARRSGYKRPIPMNPDGDEYVEDEDVHNFIRDNKVIRVQHFPHIQKISLHIPGQLTQGQIKTIRDFEKADPNLTIGYAIGRHFNKMEYGEGVRNLLMTNVKMFGQKQGGMSGASPNTTYQNSKRIRLYRNLFPNGVIKKAELDERTLPDFDRSKRRYDDNQLPHNEGFIYAPYIQKWFNFKEAAEIHRVFGDGKNNLFLIILDVNQTKEVTENFREKFEYIVEKGFVPVFYGKDDVTGIGFITKDPFNTTIKPVKMLKISNDAVTVII